MIKVALPYVMLVGDAIRTSVMFTYLLRYSPYNYLKHREIFKMFHGTFPT